jgi:hypothetical protein
LLCEKPDLLCEEIIKSLANDIFVNKETNEPLANFASVEGENQTQTSKQTNKQTNAKKYK